MEDDNDNNSTRIWRKILYEKQQFPDNYVDPKKFLEEVNLHRDTKTIDYSQIFLSATLIAQQLTATAIFLGVHRILLYPEVNVRLLLCLDLVALFVIFVIHAVLSDVSPNLKETLQSSILFLLCLRIVAPTLQNLTSTYSDDTIYALTIFFSTIHVTFHDYAFVNNDRENISSILSLNAAMFTAVVLASRLATVELVTLFMLLAVISFYLFPNTARLIKKYSLKTHVIFTLFMYTLATNILLQVDIILVYIYQIIVVFVCILCPFFFIYFSKHFKKSYKGSWDIPDIPSES